MDSIRGFRLLLFEKWSVVHSHVKIIILNSCYCCLSWLAYRWARPAPWDHGLLWSPRREGDLGISLLSLIPNNKEGGGERDSITFPTNGENITPPLFKTLDVSCPLRSPVSVVCGLQGGNSSSSPLTSIPGMSWRRLLNSFSSYIFIIIIRYSAHWLKGPWI